MSKSRKPGPKPDPESKRTKGVDRHKNPRESFHAGAELFGAMYRYIAEYGPPKTNKTEVLKAALEEFLAKRGYWPPPPENATK